MDWQTIETAPRVDMEKDPDEQGEPPIVMVWCGIAKVPLPAQWYPDYKRMNSWTDKSVWTGKGTWFIAIADGDEIQAPTHWAPMPAGPTAAPR
jgi:hypothetical protein